MEESEARRLAETLTRRNAEALAAACRAAGGERGLGLAWAVIDMIADRETPLAVVPLAHVASLLKRASTDDAARLRDAWAALMAAVEVEVGADGDHGDAEPAHDDVWGVAA